MEYFPAEGENYTENLFRFRDPLDEIDQENFKKIVINNVSEFVQPIIFSLPAQLLAYFVAVLKGTDVDQPRNLAKSVTVE